MERCQTRDRVIDTRGQVIFGITVFKIYSYPAGRRLDGRKQGPKQVPTNNGGHDFMNETTFSPSPTNGSRWHSRNASSNAACIDTMGQVIEQSKEEKKS